MKKRVWKIQVVYRRYGTESVYTVNTAASTIEEALERAYVSAYKENRWDRKSMNAKLIERLEIEVFI